MYCVCVMSLCGSIILCSSLYNSLQQKRGGANIIHFVRCVGVVGRRGHVITR